MKTLVCFGAAVSLCAGFAGHAAAETEPVEVLDSITVFGDRTPDDPGSVSAINAENITQLAADHPAEVLNTLPGVNIQMNSGQEHLIAIRSPVLTAGAGQGSFLILENGLPTRAPAFGNVNGLFELHHETADAIEIVRGPGSAKYGSNAVHGLINVIMPGVASAPEWEVRASVSSLQRYRSDLIGDTGQGMRASLSLLDETGWRDNTGLQQQKFSAIGEFDVGDWTVRPWLTVSNLNQETAGFIVGDDAYEDEALSHANANPEAFRDASSARIAAAITNGWALGDLTLTPFARTQEMRFAQHFLPNGSFEDNGHDSVGIAARFDFALAGDVQWRVGADAEFATGYLLETQPEPFGYFPGDARFPQGTHYDYDVETQDFAVWAEADWHISPDVKILAGVRAETHDYDYTTNIAPGIRGRFFAPANRSDSFDLLTPKLGIIWDRGDIDLYANYARGERAPQASDLYRLQSQQLPGEIETETLDSVEVGGRGTAFGSRLMFDVAVYWMDKENFFFRDSDRLNVPDGSTRHIGAEAAFDLAMIEDVVSLNGQISWSDQTYTFDRLTSSGSESITDGNEIDTAPEWLGDLALVWTPNEAWRGSLEAEHVGEYFTDPANTQTYPGHTVFSARASYAISPRAEVFVIVRNLTDEAYADRADFGFGDERYFPGEPLNATVGVRLRSE